jgi:hypothetical protein
MKMIRRFYEPKYNIVRYFDTVNHRFWSVGGNRGTIELHPDSDYAVNLDAVITEPDYYTEIAPLSEYIVTYTRIASPQTVHTFDFVTHGNSVSYKDDSGGALGVWETFESGVKNMEELVRTAKTYTCSLKTTEATDVVIKYTHVDNVNRWYTFDLETYETMASDNDAGIERKANWPLDKGIAWMDQRVKDGAYKKEYVDKKSQVVDIKEVMMTQKSTIRRFEEKTYHSLWYFDTINHRFWTTGATGDITTFPDGHYDVNLATVQREDDWYKELSPIAKFMVTYSSKTSQTDPSDPSHYTFDFVSHGMTIILVNGTSRETEWSSFENGVLTMESEVRMGTYVRSIETDATENSQVVDTKGLVVKYVFDGDPRCWYEFDYDTRNCVWHSPIEGDKPAMWSSFESGIEYMDRQVTHGYTKQICQRKGNFSSENEGLVVRYVLKDDPTWWYTFDFRSKTAILHDSNGGESKVYADDFDYGVKIMESLVPLNYTKEIIHSLTSTTNVVDINVPAPVRWARWARWNTEFTVAYDTVAKEWYYTPDGEHHKTNFDYEYNYMFPQNGTMPTGGKEIPVTNARKFVSSEYLYWVDVDQKKVYRYMNNEWVEVWVMFTFERNMKSIESYVSAGAWKEIPAFAKEKKSSQVPVSNVPLKKTIRVYVPTSKSDATWAYIVDHSKQTVHRVYLSNGVSEDLSTYFNKNGNIENYMNHLVEDGFFVEQTENRYFIPNKTVYPNVKWDFVWVLDYNDHTGYHLLPNGTKEYIEKDFVRAFEEGESRSRADGVGDWVELYETEAMNYLKNVGNGSMKKDDPFAPMVFKMSMWSTPKTYCSFYKMFEDNVPVVRYFRSDKYDWGYVHVIDFTNEKSWSIDYDGVEFAWIDFLDYTQDEVDLYVKGGTWFEMTKEEAIEYIKTKKMEKVLESNGHTNAEKVSKIRENLAESVKI